MRLNTKLASRHLAKLVDGLGFITGLARLCLHILVLVVVLDFNTNHIEDKLLF